MDIQQVESYTCCFFTDYIFFAVFKEEDEMLLVHKTGCGVSDLCL